MPTAHQLFFAARRDLDVFRSEFPEGKTSDHDAIDWFSEGRPREVADADDEEDAWARYWALVCQIDEHGLAIEITDEERSELERIKAQGSYDMGENGVAHCRFRDRWISSDFVEMLLMAKATGTAAERGRKIDALLAAGFTPAEVREPDACDQGLQRRQGSRPRRSAHRVVSARFAAR